MGQLLHGQLYRTCSLTQRARYLRVDTEGVNGIPREIAIVVEFAFSKELNNA